jgi:glycopeptide antibiotics resistance protein
MDYAFINMENERYTKEVSEMSIMIKLFLMAYLLVMVLLTVLSVVWVLSLIFTPEGMKRKIQSTARFINWRHG